MHIDGGIAELHVALDRSSGEPMRRQLTRELRGAIRAGRLRAAVRLPASRALAAELGVSRGVVTDAYEQLTAEGWLIARPGAGTKVAPGLGAARVAAAPRSRRVRHDFTPVSPDVSMFPRRMWERAAGRALSRAADAELDYGTGHGAPALCDALAGYLGRVRGTAADPGTIVVCGGYIQATTLLFAVLAARGLRRIAFEDPSLDDHWRSAARAGLEAVPVGVDGEGLRVDELAATDAQAVLVTPNHQFPTGAVMGADRRRALLAWAREGERLIIEDDYDAEFRYDRRPLPALQGLDPGRVVYVGTASKTLAPGVRLGWMLAPRELAEELAAEKLLSDGGSATLSQLTLAELIASGELAAHLRRVRTTYARRRARLADALAAAIPSARVEGAAAGVHLVLRLPAALDEQRLRQAMAEHGVAARLIGAPATRLVLGYGRLSTEGIGAAVGALAAAIGDAS